MNCRECNFENKGIDARELEELFEDVRYNDYHNCDYHNKGHHHVNNDFNCNLDRECCKRPVQKPIPKKGSIEVQSLLGCSDGEPISGMPIELYKIDCNTGFELVDCKYTDSCGKVSFKCLDDGLYAIKQPVDPCYFEKPEYYPCYEVCISKNNKHAKVVIINSLRKREEDCNRPPIYCHCHKGASCR